LILHVQILKDEPIAEDFDFRALAEATEGYSGSDLFSLCQKASRSPLREIINKYRHHPEPYKSIPLVILTFSVEINFFFSKDEVPRRLTLQDFLMAKNTYGRTQDVVRDYRASRGEDSSSVGTLSLRPDNSLVNLMMLSPILFALGLGVAMRTPLQNTQSNSNVNMNLQ
jgi:SpoVK/Ycf46/Vps4 family AAA+-type ATPase